MWRMQFSLQKAVLHRHFIFFFSDVPCLSHRISHPKAMYTTKMARRSTTFRVSGLPTKQPNHTLEADLLSLIEKNLLDEEKPKIHDDDTKLTIDIVPSCYDPVKESVALVDFRNWVPNFLSATMENQPEDPGWQAKMGSKDLNISLDSHNSMNPKSRLLRSKHFY
jgi:hypothetical protein